MNDNTVSPQAENALNGEKENAQEVEMVGGVACPVDPMERLQCESCQ